MRIILCNRLPRLVEANHVPEETYVFWWWEDYTVGPLKDWRDLTKFKRERAKFWSNTPLGSTPDGEPMDYVPAQQILPRHDIVELFESGATDFPPYQDFEELAPHADIIEIWVSKTVGDQVWQWFLASIFEGLGVDLHKVVRRVFNAPLGDARETGFWDELLNCTASQIVPAHTICRDEWLRMRQFWDAATTLPTPLAAAIAQQASSETLCAFNVLAARHTENDRELNNIQTRLLRATPIDWTSMARVIGNAMVMGQIDDNDHISDILIEAQLRVMASPPSPIVEIEGAGEMRFCRVRLAAEGHRRLTETGGKTHRA